jgi:hypothetical protein
MRRRFRHLLQSESHMEQGKRDEREQLRCAKTQFAITRLTSQQSQRLHHHLPTRALPSCAGREGYLCPTVMCAHLWP